MRERAGEEASQSRNGRFGNQDPDLMDATTRVDVGVARGCVGNARLKSDSWNSLIRGYVLGILTRSHTEKPDKREGERESERFLFFLDQPLRSVSDMRVTIVLS